MDISIIIISYNTRNLLRDCLHSVRQKTVGLEYEIFVVDNASSDDSCAMVKSEFPEIILVRNSENRGFAAANNQAIRMARGKYIVLLNSDTFLQNNAFEIMYRFMENNSRAGVCGPRSFHADGTVETTIKPYPSPWLFIKYKLLFSILVKAPRHKYSPEKFDYSIKRMFIDGYLQGSCLMIHSEALKQIGALDEHYFFFLEEADWEILASRSGWEIWFLPEAIITHLGGASWRSFRFTEQEVAETKRDLRQTRYFIKKHYGFWQYAVYRLAIVPIILLNFLQRTVVLLLIPKRKKSEAIFKLKREWQRFLVSIEYTERKD